MPQQPLPNRTFRLIDVLGELRLKVVDKQRSGDEWMFHIGRGNFKSSPDLPIPPEGGSFPIYSGYEDESDTLIYEEEAELNRRKLSVL